MSGCRRISRNTPPKINSTPSVAMPSNAVPVVNQIRTYWWCSPPRTGRQRMVPASLTARETGASFSKDKWRPYLVVIFHVRQQYMTEVSLAEHNNVVKALPSDRTDQPFGISVLPWGVREWRRVTNAH